MSYNYLQQIPLSIQHLKELRTLLLLGNRIKTLPDSICQLTKLETLWLGDNKLKSLPKNFSQLRHLDWHHHSELSSNFEGNPLENPPLAVCRKGMEAIEQYFNDNQA
jgi:Leucine-rich repeat (LRR) protein